MAGTRTIEVMRSEAFFQPEFPVYVNRAVEAFELPEHAHEFVEITYVSEGSGVHYIEGRPIPAQQGRLYYLPVGCRHVFRPASPRRDQPLAVYNCLFSPAYLRRLEQAFPQASEILQPYRNPKTAWFEREDSNGEYHQLFRQLHREYAARPPGYQAMLTALLMQLLTGLSRRGGDPALVKRTGGEWTAIEAALAYIDRHYAADLRIGELAERANLSVRQFSRQFLRQTGMSFTPYLQGIRVEAACRLLRETRLPMAEIAASAGYADLKFFHQVFKRKTGVAPGQYRRNGGYQNR